LGVAEATDEENSFSQPNVVEVAGEEASLYEHLATYPIVRLCLLYVALAADYNCSDTCLPFCNESFGGLEDSHTLLGLLQRLVLLRFLQSMGPASGPA